MSTVADRRLGAISLFSGCSRRILAAVDRLGVTLDVEAGRVLCHAGSVGAEFFVLVDGTVVVENSSGRVAALRPGAWFGEVALLSGAPRHATVTARTRATIVVFGKPEFAALLTIVPGIRDHLDTTTSRIIRGHSPNPQSCYQPLPAGWTCDLAPAPATRQ